MGTQASENRPPPSAVPVPTSTRRVKLRQIEWASDLRTLLAWRNDLGTLYLWERRCYPVSPEEFEEELKSDFSRGARLVQMLAETHAGEAFGTVYCYDADFTNQHALVTVFIDSAHQGTGVGVDVLALFLNYLFTYYPFQKLYMHVYEYNSPSLSLCKSAGLLEEGVLRQHRYYDGCWWNLHIFACYRDTLPTIRSVLSDLGAQEALSGKEV